MGYAELIEVTFEFMPGSSSIGEVCMRNMHNENGLEIVHENCPPDSPNINVPI